MELLKRYKTLGKIELVQNLPRRAKAPDKLRILVKGTRDNTPNVFAVFDHGKLEIFKDDQGRHCLRTEANVIVPMEKDFDAIKALESSRHFGQQFCEDDGKEEKQVTMNTPAGLLVTTNHKKISEIMAEKAKDAADVLEKVNAHKPVNIAQEPEKPKFVKSKPRLKKK